MGASAIVAFLQGEGPDSRGRTLFEVLAMDNAALERTHDFIQWLFPLPEPSAAAPEAPVLSAADIAAIGRSGLAQCALAAGTDRMDAFYRLTDHWLAPHDHNHLRITRIIRSLRLLRGDRYADEFREAVLRRAEGTPVSARSRGYWMTA